MTEFNNNPSKCNDYKCKYNIGGKCGLGKCIYFTTTSKVKSKRKGISRMKVKKIRYCANCQSEIDPHIEITEDYVVQTCPQCGHEVGRAGAFIVYPMLSNIKATIKVEAVE